MPKAPVDLAEFAALATPHRCWFTRLDEEQKAKVNAAKEAGYSSRVIAEVVNSWGVKTSRSPIQNHFSSDHACG